MIEIIASGPLATVQDLGRPGWAGWGVGRSGAADRAAHRLANRLVGNPPDAATIEVTFGGLTVRCLDATFVAVTGAVGRLTASPGAPLGPGVGVALPAGTVLTVGRPDRGLRSYLAVRGGIDVAPVLGSRATDTLAGLGPPALAPGTTLPVGEGAGPFPPAHVAPHRHPAEPEVLTVVPGPRDDWGSLPQLLATTWTVGPTSDRIGLRLDGPPVARRAGELPPEGMVRGAIQVPPDGRPVLLLADHPVTGGYPVLAVVTDAHTDRAAQLRPGDGVRFRLRRRSPVT